MIYGNKARFAVEWDLAENSQGAWMFGHVCYWICGEQFGDHEFYTSLRDVLFCWETIVGDAGRRTNERLFNMDKNELGNLLGSGLYGFPHQDETAQQRALDEMWARHVVVTEVDVFDEYQMFLVEGQNRAPCLQAR